MEFFLDTADLKTILEMSATGLIKGVTTNPAIMRNCFPECGSSVDDYYTVMMEFFCGLLNAHDEANLARPMVNLEVYSGGIDDDSGFIIDQMLRIADMVQTACTLDNLASFPVQNISIKVPLTMNALAACKVFSAQHRHRYNFDILINVTLCFSVEQALVAAAAGADYVSLFAGRLDDNGIDSTSLMRDIVKVYKNYGLSTKLLVASVRHPDHIHRAAVCGVHAATVPPGVLGSLYKNSLTDSGLKRFCDEWNQVA